MPPKTRFHNPSIHNSPLTFDPKTKTPPAQYSTKHSTKHKPVNHIIHSPSILLRTQPLRKISSPHNTHPQLPSRTHSLHVKTLSNLSNTKTNSLLELTPRTILARMLPMNPDSELRAPPFVLSSRQLGALKQEALMLWRNHREIRGMTLKSDDTTTSALGNGKRE